MPDQVAKLNYLRMTPRKIRLVADVLKGLSVNEAEAELLMQKKRAAKSLLKLLRGAVANAKNNQHLDPAKLIVKNVRVDQGPMIKRYLPRARGSASPIQRKMSHITLVLEESDSIKPPRFTIVIKKKSKTPSDKKPKKAGKEKIEHEKPETAPKRKKSGFFQKVFSRKSGMGK
ncbi:MAG: 50S ribosomal protein L22 [Candidatus Liptonbacteria bacterium]|nr:50S ribosomal protein L22 [Candidatus Liptonbacteria bacterium]